MTDDRLPACPDPLAVLDETRGDFVATFSDRCDSLRALISAASQGGDAEAMASLTQAVHRLSGLAGTIGFPTISLRSLDLEDLLGTASSSFDPIIAATLVDAVRAALDIDVANRASAAAEGHTLPAANVASLADAASQPDTLIADLQAAGCAPDVAARVQVLMERNRVPRPASGNESDGTPTAPTTILIAEDDPDVTRIVDAQLRASGYTTLVAFDGEQTLAAIQDQTPDVLVLDLMMPKLSGFEVLMQLRDAPPPRPRVIVLSARGREQDMARAFELGAHDYMTKPFDPQELTARIARLLT